ncbi:exodeoxyribonuclease VII large subunit [Candidatus Woesebacteria bacterium]|nr:exodeoxyribonuclease VII large subunit [Candidatus Woesebacteria bacterium]
MQTIDGKQVYSVSEVNYFAKQSLEQLETWVIGEVQQIQQNDNWYYNYIKLIDDNSVLPAICTRDVLGQVGKLTPGQKVLIYGFPTLFDKKGEYKFKICVQGGKSVGQLLKVLPKVDKMNFDVVVITRGGGSLEDLAAFNDEMVARAIFAMETPTIVAIGHEANESLAEWVADRRASTPTDAANIVTFGYNQVLEKLNHHRQAMTAKLNSFSLNYFQRLDNNYRQLLHMKTYFKDLPHILDSYGQKLKHNQKYIVSDATVKLKEIKTQMKMFASLNLDNKKQTLQTIGNSLKLLSPENILTRGYTITTDEAGKVVRSINTVVVGATVGVKLKDGSFTSVVKTKK